MPRLPFRCFSLDLSLAYSKTSIHSFYCGRWHCMPISVQFFELLKHLSVIDLFELLVIIPILLRAKLAGVDLNHSDVLNSSTGGLHREAVRTGRLERISDPSTDPPLAYLATPRNRVAPQSGGNSQTRPERSRSRSSYSSLDTEPEHRPGPNSVGGFRKD